MPSNKRFLIHERFLTWQGEGVHMGRKAYFIRTYGCPLQCDFCDSAGTWHKDFKPDHLEQMTENELLDAAVRSCAPLIVLTGGEPAMHNWSSFIQRLHAHSPLTKVHLETSGAFPIRGGFDWITVSPKRAKLPHSDVWLRADEFKLIVETPEDISFWAEILMIRRNEWDKTPIWLHPEWSQRENPLVLEAINAAVIERGDPFRVGYQLHKLYRPDQRDEGCRVEVPLGGGQKLEPVTLPFTQS